jgi:hypothetical protein
MRILAGRKSPVVMGIQRLYPVLPAALGQQSPQPLAQRRDNPAGQPRTAASLAGPRYADEATAPDDRTTRCERHRPNLLTQKVFDMASRLMAAWLTCCPGEVICAAMLASAAVRTRGKTMPSTPYTYTSPDDPAREDEGLFGPGSVTWRVMSSRIMWVAIVRALYLQALHPRVIRGTLQNAATITEPVDAWPG